MKIRDFQDPRKQFLESDMFLSMLKNHQDRLDGIRGVSPSCHPSLMGGF